MLPWSALYGPETQALRIANVMQAISTWPSQRWKCAGACWDVGVSESSTCWVRADKSSVELAERGERGKKKALRLPRGSSDGQQNVPAPRTGTMLAARD